jgi:hypothetical protein
MFLISLHKNIETQVTKNDFMASKSSDFMWESWALFFSKMWNHAFAKKPIKYQLNEGQV